MNVKPRSNIKTTITVAGDKSISHRSIMFASLAKGETNVTGFLTGEDCLSTIDCFKKMGVKIDVDGTNVKVVGKGLRGLEAPVETLDVGNSGTTLRLITGILAAQNFTTNITGDESIKKRPMDRVVTPIKQMGGEVLGVGGDKIFAPLTINGKDLTGMEYELPVASAQVKSAILLASLYADKPTYIKEPEKTRDHTEIMLNYFGADIKREGDVIISTPVKELIAKDIEVPGDISSAAFFMVAALITKDSEIKIENIGINPTRTGIITALLDMGAEIKIENEKNINGELVGDIICKSQKLKGTTIGGDIIPKLIDEIPILAVAACFAEGETVIKDAAELKVKESNRIKTTVCELKKLGADIMETDDGMIIKGGSGLAGGEIESHNDHRIAMSMAIAGLASENGVTINSPECANISFPNFYDLLNG